MKTRNERGRATWDARSASRGLGRGPVLGVISIIAVIAAVFWWRSRSLAPPAPAPVVASPPAAQAGAPVLPVQVRPEIPPESISPIANDLNAPGGTIQHDLEILNAVFEAWQTNFPRDGNPVGENDEITAALTGGNRLHFAFISPKHPAINANGQLCDRWGTPFRFHQLSGTVMEIRSAGPDRKFGTDDDTVFSPR